MRNAMKSAEFPCVPEIALSLIAYSAPAALWVAHAERLKDAVARYKIISQRPILDIALEAIANGRFDQALERARGALELNPDCVIAWRLLAMAYEGSGEIMSAFQAYESAYHIDPGSSDILSELGRLADHLGLTQVSVEFFALALAAAPTSPHLVGPLSKVLRTSLEHQNLGEGK